MKIVNSMLHGIHEYVICHYNRINKPVYYRDKKGDLVVFKTREEAERTAKLAMVANLSLKRYEICSEHW